jgi:hypothetical protein
MIYLALPSLNPKARASDPLNPTRHDFELRHGLELVSVDPGSRVPLS